LYLLPVRKIIIRIRNRLLVLLSYRTKLEKSVLKQAYSIF